MKMALKMQNNQNSEKLQNIQNKQNNQNFARAIPPEKDSKERRSENSDYSGCFEILIVLVF